MLICNMKKITTILCCIIILASCSNDTCEPGCPDFEVCVGRSSQDMFGTRYYSCVNILDGKYGGTYTGKENIEYSNGEERNIDQIISIGRIYDNLARNMMNLTILFDIDEISEENYRNLQINFSTPESDMFFIPRQSIYGPIYNHLSNSIIYTYIYYEGTGNITDNKLTVNYTCEFFQQSTKHNFTQN